MTTSEIAKRVKFDALKKHKGIINKKTPSPYVSPKKVNSSPKKGTQPPKMALRSGGRTKKHAKSSKIFEETKSLAVESSAFPQTFIKRNDVKD